MLLTDRAMEIELEHKRSEITPATSREADNYSEALALKSPAISIPRG
jgi:hypothetical protein